MFKKLSYFLTNAHKSFLKSSWFENTIVHKSYIKIYDFAFSRFKVYPREYCECGTQHSFSCLRVSGYFHSARSLRKHVSRLYEIQQRCKRQRERETRFPRAISSSTRNVALCEDLFVLFHGVDYEVRASLS